MTPTRTPGSPPSPPSRARRHPVVRAIVDDFGLKLLAVLTSLFIFYLVRGAEDAQRSFFVDVVVLLPEDPDRVLMSEVPERVRLTVQGTQSILSTIQRDALGPLEMDLRADEPSYFYFDAAGLDLPAGVRVVQLTPASVPLSWEDRVDKDVSVLPQLVGEPPAGLAVADPARIRPSVVEVQGPRSLIDGLDVLRTAEVSVVGLPAGVHEREVPLVLGDPRLEVTGPSTVAVTFELSPKRAERTFPPTQVAVPEAPLRTRVRPPRVTITVVGPPGVVARIEPEAVIPTVSTEDIPDGSRDVPSAVRVYGVPANVDVRVEPEEVLVTLPRRGAVP